MNEGSAFAVYDIHVPILTDLLAFYLVAQYSYRFCFINTNKKNSDDISFAIFDRFVCSDILLSYHNC